MKAAYLNGNTGPEGLMFGKLPPPMPGVDLVFDSVGGETLARSWSVLKPGVRVITSRRRASRPPIRGRTGLFLSLSRTVGYGAKSRDSSARALRSFVEAVSRSRARAAYARALRGIMPGIIALQVATS